MKNLNAAHIFFHLSCFCSQYARITLMCTSMDPSCHKRKHLSWEEEIFLLEILFKKETENGRNHLRSWQNPKSPNLITKRKIWYIAEHISAVACEKWSDDSKRRVDRKQADRERDGVCQCGDVTWAEQQRAAAYVGCTVARQAGRLLLLPLI